MNTPIIHYHRLIRRKFQTHNTTWCGRDRLLAGGWNISSHAHEVTCKHCLNIIAAQVARAAQELEVAS